MINFELTHHTGAMFWSAELKILNFLKKPCKTTEILGGFDTKLTL